MPDITLELTHPKTGEIVNRTFSAESREAAEDMARAAGFTVGGASQKPAKTKTKAPKKGAAAEGVKS